MKTCGKLAKLVHMFPKNAKNNSFSIWFEFIYFSIYGNLWVIYIYISLSLSLQTEHCGALQDKWSKTAVFLFRHFKQDPNETRFPTLCFYWVSISKHPNEQKLLLHSCFCLNWPWKISKNTAVLWVLVINYDNVSGKLIKSIHMCTYQTENR